MKLFRDYLTESKKVYTFKMKVAGELPESFEEEVKNSLVSYGEITLSKEGKTPITETPLDFPDLRNQEVHIFSVTTEYPVTPPQLHKAIAHLEIPETHFKIRGALEPSEVDQLTKDEIVAGDNTLLTNTNYEEVENAKHEEFYGEEYNTGFLKELENDKKERETQRQKEHDFGTPLTGE